MGIHQDVEAARQVEAARADVLRELDVTRAQVRAGRLDREIATHQRLAEVEEPVTAAASPDALHTIPHRAELLDAEAKMDAAIASAKADLEEARKATGG